MGIRNIFKFLESIFIPSRIQTYRGKKFAVDVSPFIYKAVFHYPDHMRHIDNYMNCISKSADHVYLICDGPPPESKAKELADREKHRENYDIYSKIPEVIQEFIEAYIGKEKFTIIISPQESDSQLAYMSLKAHVDYIITEDSDLIVYGCDRIIFKLKPNGSCIVYKREKLEKFIETFNWDFQTFKFVCILCGCDYLKGGIKGLGFHRASKIFNHPFLSDFQLKQFLQEKFGITDTFFQDFKKACDSYTNQLVNTKTKIGPLYEMLAEV